MGVVCQDCSRLPAIPMLTTGNDTHANPSERRCRATDDHPSRRHAAVTGHADAGRCQYSRRRFWRMDHGPGGHCRIAAGSPPCQWPGGNRRSQCLPVQAPCVCRRSGVVLRPCGQGRHDLDHGQCRSVCRADATAKRSGQGHRSDPDLRGHRRGSQTACVTAAGALTGLCSASPDTEKTTLAQGGHRGHGLYQAACCVAGTSSRNWRRKILPTLVLGSSVRNSMNLGFL